MFGVFNWNWIKTCNSRIKKSPLSYGQFGNLLSATTEKTVDIYGPSISSIMIIITI